MRKLYPTRSSVRDHFVRRAFALWRDTDGLMAPYVAVMLPVLVGFALLAVDSARRMSLQRRCKPPRTASARLPESANSTNRRVPNFRARFLRWRTPTHRRNRPTRSSGSDRHRR